MIIRARLNQDQMAKVSNVNRKLEVINRQLYGKELNTRKESISVSMTDLNRIHSQTVNLNQLEPSNLKADLLKIAFFSAVAMLIQFALYIAIQRNLINIGF